MCAGGGAGRSLRLPGTSSFWNRHLAAVSGASASNAQVWSSFGFARFWGSAASPAFFLGGSCVGPGLCVATACGLFVLGRGSPCPRKPARCPTKVLGSPLLACGAGSFLETTTILGVVRARRQSLYQLQRSGVLMADLPANPRRAQAEASNQPMPHARKFAGSSNRCGCVKFNHAQRFTTSANLEASCLLTCTSILESRTF